MSLGDVGPIQAWSTRETPSDQIWRLVVTFIFLISERPYRAPSKPLSLPEGQPREIRGVTVPNTGGVMVTYEHAHETGVVDLLLIATEG